MGEYRYGVMFSRHRSEYEQQLSAIELDLPVISVCYQTAKHYAAIRKELKAAGSPIPWHDLWIAAQSRQYDLPVLSRDKHFVSIEGVTRLSW